MCGIPLGEEFVYFGFAFEVKPDEDGAEVAYSDTILYFSQASNRRKEPRVSGVWSLRSTLWADNCPLCMQLIACKQVETQGKVLILRC